MACETCKALRGLIDRVRDNLLDIAQGMRDPKTRQTVIAMAHLLSVHNPALEELYHAPTVLGEEAEA